MLGVIDRTGHEAHPPFVAGVGKRSGRGCTLQTNPDAFGPRPAVGNATQSVLASDGLYTFTPQPFTVR